MKKPLAHRRKDGDAVLAGLAPLKQRDQKRWLIQHIPHRLRAASAILQMPGDWETGWHVRAASSVQIRCVTDSVWEGRLTAMRWLIMFVGISADSDKFAVRPLVREHDNDVFISRFSNGVTALFPFGRTANKLARVWVGCSKATSHPTDRTKHPKVNPPQISEALSLIVAHLENTIYRTTPKTLREVTLTDKSAKQLYSEWS